MSTLYFPSATVNLVVGGTAAGTLGGTNASHPSHITGNNVAGNSLLIIYKGVAASFPSFSDRNTRVSDVLITFSIGSNGWSSLGIINNAARWLIGKIPASTTAAASGTATWFLLCRSGTTTLSDKGALIGIVGLTGSGADLELPTLDIISGVNYQCAGFYINMPQIWTVP